LERRLLIRWPSSLPEELQDFHAPDALGEPGGFPFQIAGVTGLADADFWELGISNAVI